MHLLNEAAVACYLFQIILTKEGEEEPVKKFCLEHGCFFDIHETTVRVLIPQWVDAKVGKKFTEEFAI